MDTWPCQQFISFFSGFKFVWDSFRLPLPGPPLHRGAGCCSGREADRAQKLIESEVLKPMPLPATNKWTKVAPTVAHIAFLCLFQNGFVVDAFRAESGALQDEESDPSNNEHDKLGVRANEARKGH